MLCAVCMFGEDSRVRAGTYICYRLSADLKGCFDSIRSLNQTQTDKHSQLLERLGHIDSRVSSFASRCTCVLVVLDFHLQPCLVQLCHTA